MSFAHQLIEQTQCAIQQALLAYWGKHHPSMLVISSIDPQELINSIPLTASNAPIAFQHKQVTAPYWQAPTVNLEMLDLLKQIPTMQIRELYLHPKDTHDNQQVSNLLAGFLGSMLAQTSMSPKEAHAALAAFCSTHGLPMPDHTA